VQGSSRKEKWNISNLKSHIFYYRDEILKRMGWTKLEKEIEAEI